MEEAASPVAREPAGIGLVDSTVARGDASVLLGVRIEYLGFECAGGLARVSIQATGLPLSTTPRVLARPVVPGTTANEYLPSRPGLQTEATVVAAAPGNQDRLAGAQPTTVTTIEADLPAEAIPYYGEKLLVLLIGDSPEAEYAYVQSNTLILDREQVSCPPSAP